jgi:hypothetical protein
MGMAWDRTRPVPWERLVRDWVLYIGVMTVIFLVAFRDRISAGLVAGLLVSGPLFVAIGAVLAKLGYQRKSLRELRAQSAERAAAAASVPSVARSGPRGRPAPTKRTSTGPTHRPTPKRKR